MKNALRVMVMVQLTKFFKTTKYLEPKKKQKNMLKKQRFLLKMKRDFLDNSNDIDWSNEHQIKHNIYYSQRFNSIYVDEWKSLNYGMPVTTNHLWLEEYIEKYEKEIKRYYFGIEED